MFSTENLLPEINFLSERNLFTYAYNNGRKKAWSVAVLGKNPKSEETKQSVFRKFCEQDVA